MGVPGHVHRTCRCDLMGRPRPSWFARWRSSNALVDGVDEAAALLAAIRGFLDGGEGRGEHDRVTVADVPATALPVRPAAARVGDGADLIGVEGAVSAFSDLLEVVEARPRHPDDVRAYLRGLM